MQKACRWLPAILAAALVPTLASTAVPATQQQYQLVDPGPNGFTLKRVEAPVRPPGAGEVLVRVRAAALNRRDIYVIDGQYPIGSRTNVVPLSDGAGEVAAVGASVKRFRVGDRVAAIFFQNWVNGRPAADTPMTALSGALDGMLSEYVTLNETGLVKVPANLSYEEAATLSAQMSDDVARVLRRGRR
jgi:NADPH:quinone reductase-like Zn-dependent oxidoreductase